MGTANRMVTLAAFHAIEADKTNTSDVKAAMNDSMSVTCLEEAQMQLMSCVSAAHIRSDLTFCLARHGLQAAGRRRPLDGRLLLGNREVGLS